MKSPKQAVAAICAAALTVILGACSSAGSPSAASSSSGAAGSSGAPIKVGAICSCSGGTFGGQHEALYDVYDAWVKTTNAAGGINGHQVQLIKEDDAASPATALSVAKSLVSDKVDAVVDLSLIDTVWAKTIDAAKIPVVGGDVSDAVFDTDPNFYPEGETPDSTAAAMAATVKQAGQSTVGILYCAESVSCQQLLPEQRAAVQQAGLKLGYVSSISATAPNYTAQCLAAKQAGVGALLVFHGAQVVARIGPDCRQQGYSPVYVTEGTGYSPQLQTAAGIDDTLWSVFSDIPYFTTTPAVEAADAGIDKYYPGLRKDVNNWSQLAFEAWMCGLLLKAAVQASGLTAADTPSPAEVIKGLGALNGNDLDGTAPPLSFAGNGKPNLVDCWFTGRLQNGGTSSVANGGKPTCAANA